MFNKYHETATNLLERPTDEIKKWIDSIDTILCDCDGVLWIRSEVIPGSLEAVNKFKELNKKVYFVTNNSTKTRSEFLDKAVKLGFNINENEIISTAYCTARYLKNRGFNRKAYVIGSSGIAQEFDAVGIEYTGIGPEKEFSLQDYCEKDFQCENNIGAVIVGFDENFNYMKMVKAASYLNDPNCLFIATNTDERFPLKNYVIPGTGSIVRAVETSAERDAIVIGKPFLHMCEDLLKDGTIIPERTLMIGDRCNSDVLFGKTCGFQTLLVGTGINNLGDVKKWRESDNEEDKRLIPDVYLPKLGNILQYL